MLWVISRGKAAGESVLHRLRLDCTGLNRATTAEEWEGSSVFPESEEKKSGWNKTKDTIGVFWQFDYDWN